MSGVPANRVAVARMGVAVHAFQHCGDCHHGEGPLNRESGLESSRAGSAAPAGTALGAPFRATCWRVIGGADGTDAGERGCQFRFQSAADVGKDRMEQGAPVPVFRLANASIGMGTILGSGRAACHIQRQFQLAARLATDHLQ